MKGKTEMVLNGSLGSQTWFFYELAVKKLSGPFIFKSVKHPRVSCADLSSFFSKWWKIAEEVCDGQFSAGTVCFICKVKCFKAVLTLVKKK